MLAYLLKRLQKQTLDIKKQKRFHVVHSVDSFTAAVKIIWKNTCMLYSFPLLQSNPIHSSCAGLNMSIDLFGRPSMCVCSLRKLRLWRSASAQRDSIHPPSAHSETQRPDPENSLNSLPGTINWNFCAIEDILLMQKSSFKSHLGTIELKYKHFCKSPKPVAKQQPILKQSSKMPLSNKLPS